MMMRRLIFAAMMCGVCFYDFAVPGIVLAQSDSISLIVGRPPRGTVDSSTSEELVISTDDGEVKVQPWNLRQIRFAGEPNALTSARTAYADDRYSVCYQGLENLDPESDRILIKQEIEFYRTMAGARLALSGGNVTTNKAGTDLLQFVKGNPDSFHVLEAIDALGDLALSLGNFDLAIAQFQKTAASAWPELSFNGGLKVGKAQLLGGKYAEAIASFTATEASDNGEDYAVQSKLIAKCLRAKALGLTGKPAEGLAIVQAVIDNESSKNTVLFANAYNARGTCLASEEKTKEAIRAFLHTDLLFTLDPESHAEALYYLNDLWTKMDRLDRAARARQKIMGRYRNTWWASKIKG